MEKQRIKIIQPIDINILVGLYEYRAFSTEQIRRRYNMGDKYVFNKISLLRNTGLISSKRIKRYIGGGGNQGSYHRITDAGIRVLQKRGFICDRKAYELNVNDNLIPYVLTTNDLMIDLERYGWVLTDSRETKSRLVLNRNGNIQGTLQNVSTGSVEYAVYNFLENVSDKNLMKAVGEIGNTSILNNYLFFIKGKEVFKKILDALMVNEQINQINSLKILPHTFGKLYLKKFEEEDNLLEYILNEPEYNISSLYKIDKNKVNSHYSGLTNIVIHNGEEKYFVNLLDLDLKKINSIKQYRKEYYENDGKKILILSNTIEELETMLSNYHHVSFLNVNLPEFIKHMKAY